jgi:hypothetical protein
LNEISIDFFLPFFLSYPNPHFDGGEPKGLEGTELDELDDEELELEEELDDDDFDKLDDGIELTDEDELLELELNDEGTDEKLDSDDGNDDDDDFELDD